MAPGYSATHPALATRQRVSPRPMSAANKPRPRISVRLLDAIAPLVRRALPKGKVRMLPCISLVCSLLSERRHCRPPLRTQRPLKIYSHFLTILGFISATGVAGWPQRTEDTGVFFSLSPLSLLPFVAKIKIPCRFSAAIAFLWSEKNRNMENTIKYHLAMALAAAEVSVYAAS